MQNIIGTLLTVEQFLNNEDTEIKVNTSSAPNEKVYKLDKGRVYVIPNYQREIRWGEKQLNDLIHDIMDSKQFLGNVILSRKDKKYEIIDGQQRITILRMLIKYIYLSHPYPEYLPKFTLCPLEIDSFSDYKHFEETDFSISSEDFEKIQKTDDYHQSTRYNYLWNLMEQSDILQDEQNKDEFLKKLFAANLNIIINNDASTHFEVEYFVDVNQKGVQLDIEDTLKGYLFQIGSPAIKAQWVEIKKKCYLLSDKVSCENILLLIFEQYFYCELYKDPNFSKLIFKQDFTLSAKFINPQTNKTYLKDTHLIQVICHSRNIVTDLKNISSILSVIYDVVSNENYSSEFKQYFNQKLLVGKNKLEANGITCIYVLLRRILCDSNDVPKVLAIKYITDLLLNTHISQRSIDDEEKKELKTKYQNIFQLYALYTLFSLSATKKQKDRLYEAIKGDDWEEKISNSINWFLSKGSMLKSKYTFSYNTFTKENVEDNYADALRCKSIALLYNFLIYDENKKTYTFNKHEQLYDYLIDVKQYSLEHFLLNQGLSCIMSDKNHSECSYPNSVKKYIGSCFNFIFVHKDINGAILGNYSLSSKMQILLKHGTAYDELKTAQITTLNRAPITCEYSNMIVNLITNKKYFEKYMEIDSSTPDKLISYFEEEFVEEYFEFVDDVIYEFYHHLPKLKG